MAIPFTQYLRPDGRQLATSIDRPADVEELAQAVIRSGARFESEMLTDGTISLECVGPEDDDGDRDSLATELVDNGPGVLDAVDRLVRAAHAKVSATEAQR